MFYCFCGNKGGGKSYGLLQLIVDELRLTNRPIMTNLSLNLGRLQQWVDSQKWGKVVDVALRIYIMEPKQIAEWFKWTPKGYITSQQSIERAGGATSEIDYSCRENDGGILFVIDEAHVPFPSDRWAAVAKECSFYCTQERKLLDDTIFATQAPDQMAKPLRQLMQEWTETRNMNREPILGMRFPGKFRWRVTLRQPDGRDQVAINHRIVMMDKQLRECYNTMAGVGITGRGDPNAERGARGLRWQVWVGLFVVGIICFGFGVYYGGKAGFRFIQRAATDMVGIKVESKPVSVSSSQSLSNQIQTQIAPRVQAIQPVQFRSNEVTEVKNNRLYGGRSEPREVTFDGWSINGGQATVYLSDGRRITGKDPLLRHVSREFVIYGDERIYPSRMIAKESERSDIATGVPYNASPQLTRQVRVGGRVLNVEKREAFNYDE